MRHCTIPLALITKQLQLLGCSKKQSWKLNPALGGHQLSRGKDLRPNPGPTEASWSLDLMSMGPGLKLLRNFIETAFHLKMPYCLYVYKSRVVILFSILALVPLSYEEQGDNSAWRAGVLPNLPYIPHPPDCLGTFPGTSRTSVRFLWEQVTQDHVQKELYLPWQSWTSTASSSPLALILSAPLHSFTPTN